MKKKPVRPAINAYKAALEDVVRENVMLVKLLAEFVDYVAPTVKAETRLSQGLSSAVIRARNIIHPHKFKPGDVVREITGGPRMTVETIHGRGPSSGVIAVWFATKASTPDRKMFRADKLEHSSAAAK